MIHFQEVFVHIMPSNVFVIVINATTLCVLNDDLEQYEHTLC